MTLVVVVPSKEGVIMASDCQVTIGGAKTRSKKIGKLNDNCVWGAAGDVAFIQMAERQITKISNKLTRVH